MTKKALPFGGIVELPTLLIPTILSLGIVLSLASCTTAPAPELSPQLCDFVITSDVDGVKIENPLVGTVQSVAGEEHRFALPCTEQTFALSKPCYDSLQISLTPEDASKYRLSADDWLHHGYLRVENDSTSEPLVIGNLPNEALEVPAHAHGVRPLPLGDYALDVSAPYKVGVAHDLRLCAKDEIYSLRVSTEEAEGELVAQGSQELTLDHGTGSLRVLTTEPDVSFRIEPDRSEALHKYLEKVGLKNLADLTLNEAPKRLRRGLALIQRLGSQNYKAPILIRLPAGRYAITSTKTGARNDVEIHPGKSQILILEDER